MVNHNEQASLLCGLASVLSDRQINTMAELLTQYEAMRPLLWRVAPKMSQVIRDVPLEFEQAPQCPNGLRLLYQDARGGQVKALAKTQQLKQIAKAFKSAGVTAYLLKGCAFNCWLYDASTPRLTNDIDLLVMPQDWNKAVSALKAHMQYMTKPIPGVFEDAVELSFIPLEGTSGYAVDLHVALTHEAHFAMDYVRMAQDAKVHSDLDGGFCRLSVEDNILHQAIHGFKNLSFSSYGLLDTHYLLQKLPNTEPLLKRVHESGTSIALYFLLMELSKLYLSQASLHHYHEKLLPLIESIEPNPLRRFLCRISMAINVRPLDVERKSFAYRLKQVLFQYLFTCNLKKVIGLQWSFVKAHARQG